MPITIIEGFGDEVILVASSLLVLCLTVVASWKLWLRLQGPIAIHPANERDVAEARRHLGVHDENGQPRARRILGDEPCPICLVRPNFAVSTNCGHVFCAVCILEYYSRQRDFPRPVKCPVCRQVVTLLLTNFSQEEADNVGDLGQRIHDYNRRCGGAPQTLGDRIRDMPVLVRYLLRQLWSPNGVVLVMHLRVYVAVVLCVLYVMMPFDIIPESVVGIVGLVDDLVMVIFLFFYLAAIVRLMVMQRARRQQAEAQ